MTVEIITKLEDLPQFDRTKPVFCDIETQGLYINTRLIQFYQPNNIVYECVTCNNTTMDLDTLENDGDTFGHCNTCNETKVCIESFNDIIYIFDVAPISYDKTQYKSTLDAVKEYMKDLWLVFYNGSYDLGTLDIVPYKLDDMFYAVKSAYPEFMEFGLAKVTEMLPYTKGLYDGLDKKKLQKQGFVLGAYLSQQQIRYSATDVLALARMWDDEKIKAIMCTNLAYKVDILSQKYAIQYQQNGLIVDLASRNKKLMQSISDVERLEKLLPSGFNPNSYKQVRAYLDTEESDNEALVKYALSERPKAKEAKTIIDLKRAKKEVSYLESINFAKMYTRFNVAGAATGRFTASGGDMADGFNSQQIPRQFQKLFKADTEDTAVIGRDYSTLELRLACAIYGEPEMYRQLMAGEDLHTAMAMTTTGKPLHQDGVLPDTGVLDYGGNSSAFITSSDRTLAKSINFGYVFGMSANTYQNYAFISYGKQVSSEEAVSIRDAYFTKYPAIKKYHSWVWNNYKKPDFYYETALGRRTKPKLGTDGINGPVQGSGGETTKLAVHYLIKADCDRLGLDFTTEWHKCDAIKYIFNVVHDAIYIRVPKKEKELWTERLDEAMVKGWTEISKTSLFKYKDIPMPVGD